MEPSSIRRSVADAFAVLTDVSGVLIVRIRRISQAAMCRAEEQQGALSPLAVAAAKQQKTEAQPYVKVRGRLVDLSAFKHPGGNVINYFYGLDATNAFDAFHGHSRRAEIILKSLPDLAEEPADAIKQPEAHVSAMAELYADWRARGLFEPRPVSAGLYGLAVTATIVLTWVLAPTYPVMAGLLVGLAWAHCGFLQHMGGHRELGWFSLPWQVLDDQLPLCCCWTSNLAKLLSILILHASTSAIHTQKICCPTVQSFLEHAFACQLDGYGCVDNAAIVQVPQAGSLLRQQHFRSLSRRRALVFCVALAALFRGSAQGRLGVVVAQSAQQAPREDQRDRRGRRPAHDALLCVGRDAGQEGSLVVARHAGLHLHPRTGGVRLPLRLHCAQVCGSEEYVARARADGVALRALLGRARKGRLHAARRAHLLLHRLRLPSAHCEGRAARTRVNAVARLFGEGLHMAMNMLAYVR
eukprot:6178144-Pleurochrysis_carterae.AAC.2